MSATRKLNEFDLTPPVQLTIVSDSKLSSQLSETEPSPPKLGIIAGATLDNVLGRVLNLNILGQGSKICSYSCSYCQMGPTTVRLNQIKKEATLPTLEQVVRELRAHLQEATGEAADFETICLSGNGEPTLHPDFSEITSAILDLRRKEFPQKKVAIRTNASTLDSRKILEAVNQYDERVVKLDAGNDRLFKSFNNPLTRKTLSRLIGDIRSLKDVLIETLFVQGTADNTEPSDVDDWMEVVAMTQPKRVHIKTISKLTNLSGLRACDEDTLYTIASRFERRTQIRAIVAE